MQHLHTFHMIAWPLLGSVLLVGLVLVKVTWSASLRTVRVTRETLRPKHDEQG